MEKKTPILNQKIWEEKGIFLHPQIEIKEGPHGFGIFCKKEYKPETEKEKEVILIKLPTKYIINPSSIIASDSNFENDIKELSKIEKLTDRQTILLFLMKEKYNVEQKIEDNSSKWKWYIELLPSSFDTPLWWFYPTYKENQITWKFLIKEANKSENESIFSQALEPIVYETWNSSFLGHLVQMKLALLHSEWNSLQELVLKCKAQLKSLPSSIFEKDDYSNSDSVSNWRRFLWAHSIFGSRRFSEAEVLLPILDFFNHSPQGKVQWEVIPNENVHASISPKNCQPDSELFFSYGPKSNEALVFQYGFALESNIHEQIVFFFPFMPEDPKLEEKYELTQKLNIKPQLFLSGSTKQFTPQSNWLLKIGLADENEFEQIQKDFQNSSSNTDLINNENKIISPMNEKRIISFITWIIQDRLNQEAEQLRWLEDVNPVERSPKLENAIKVLHTYHIGQYNILLEALSLIQEKSTD